MAEIINLTATPRAEQGTRPARRLRATGKIPAVVYGMGTEPQAITVDWRELRQALTTDQGLNAVIHLSIDGSTSPTLVKVLQRHPVRRDVLHVDFLRVDLDKPVDADVPVVLTGEALKVTQAEGGMVEQVVTALSVTAKPDAIPPQLTVDITDLEIGDAIRVGDIELPEGVTTSVDPEEPIVTGQVVQVEVPEAAEAEEAAEGEAPVGEEAAAEGEGEGAPDGGAEGGEAAEE